MHAVQLLVILHHMMFLNFFHIHFFNFLDLRCQLLTPSSINLLTFPFLVSFSLTFHFPIFLLIVMLYHCSVMSDGGTTLPLSRGVQM